MHFFISVYRYKTFFIHHTPSIIKSFQGLNQKSVRKVHFCIKKSVKIFKFFLTFSSETLTFS
jgi:hypothetical protein